MNMYQRVIRPCKQRTMAILIPLHTHTFQGLDVQRSSVKIVLNLSPVWPPVLVLFNSRWTWLCSNFCQSIWLSSSGWCFALCGVIWYTFIFFFRTFAPFFPRTSRETLGFNRDQLSKNRLVELRTMLGWSNIFKILISLERTPTHGTSAKKTRFSQWFSQGKRINEQLIHFSLN